MRKLCILVGAAGLLGAVACSNDVLSVTNPNAPDITQALATPANIESIIGSSFNTVWAGTVGVNTDGIVQQMMTMSFENSSSLANFGMGTRIGLPRSIIDNSPGNPVLAGNYYDFQTEDKGAKSAALGLAKLNVAGTTLGSATQDARARAFAFFVMGYGNANVALVYDSGAAVTEKNAIKPDGSLFTGPFPLIAHDSLMRLALTQMDSAIAEAGLMGTTTLLTTWIPSNALTSAAFIQVIRSYKARFRAEVARTPAERAALDWTQVRDDAVNGIQADLILATLPSAGWTYGWYSQHFLFDAWTQQTPMFLGMADSSGQYDAYLATPLFSRSAILIRSADKRLPSGDTRAAQQAYSGTGSAAPSNGNYFRNRSAVDPPGLPYTVSQYDWYRMQALFNANRIGNFPMLQKAEVDLLAAEAYYRLGDFANAATRINFTRTANGKLPPLPLTMTATSTVPGGNACVPRIPNPATSYQSSICGTLFEALKWEKRIELAFMQYGAWYFDSRGWGDLAQGTALEWPVPYQEMQARNEPFYNQRGGAAKGTYGY
jgi:SusD family.